MQLDHVVDVIAARVAVHNMCHLCGDEYLDHWTETDAV